MSISTTLQRLRRRIAPPHSRREKIARLAYVPILELLPSRWHMRLRGREAVAPHVERIAGLAVSGSILEIVIFKLDHLGDLILGLPALQVLREGFPDARITLVCASWNIAWGRQLGCFDRIVGFDFFSRLNRDWLPTALSLQSLYESVRLLPLERYDLAVDLRHDPDTRGCLFRVDARYRAGFFAPAEDGLPYLDLMLPSTEGITVAPGQVHSMHAELRLRLLAHAVVATFGPDRRPHPAPALLRQPGHLAGPRFAVLAIGAGDPIRCWPLERYAEIGRALIAGHRLRIVVLAGPSEGAEAEALAASLPADWVRTEIGRDLRELPDLVARAALCVCNGSGVSHLAAALGVPTLCILGGTTRMDVWHPVGPHVESLGGVTSCQPCGLKRAEQCPWGVACLDVVSVRDVLDAAERLLGAGAAARRDARGARGDGEDGGDGGWRDALPADLRSPAPAGQS
jgi:ADP-heptose:LPS heptosyltransferase